jgi:hypothetical protein
MWKGNCHGKGKTRKKKGKEINALKVMEKEGNDFPPSSLSVTTTTDTG